MHRLHSMTPLSLLLIGTLLPFAPGCGKSGSKGGASKSSGDQSKPVELVEYALNKAGPTWVGFSAKAPKGCKVMGDLGNAARIAGKGPGLGDDSGRNGFDVIFTAGKMDLAKEKERRQARWAKAKGKGEFELLTDKPDLLAWREGKGKYRAFHFLLHLNVGSQAVTCHTNLMRGGGTEAEHQAHLATCRTLRKK